MNKGITIGLQNNDFYSPELQKAIARVLEELEKSRHELVRIESVANTMLADENVTAEAVEEQSKARFARIAALKRTRSLASDVEALFSRMTGESSKEEDRAREAVDRLIPQIADKLVKIGFTEPQAATWAGQHPSVAKECMAGMHAANIRNGQVGSYRQVLKQQLEQLGFDLQQAVRSATA